MKTGSFVLKASLSLVILCVEFASSSAYSETKLETFHAKITPLGKPSETLFQLLATNEINGAETIRKNRYSDPSGNDLVLEDVLVRDGKLVSYKINHKQTGATGSIEVKGEKVFFSYTRDGETETDEEDVEKNLVVGPILIEFMRAHWQDLMKGETLPIRLAVADRQETVGFKLFLDKEYAVDGSQRVTIEMKPSSIVIAAIVKPLYFDFEKETQKMVAIHGRTIPKVKKDGKWTDFDGDLIYQ